MKTALNPVHFSSATITPSVKFHWGQDVEARLFEAVEYKDQFQPMINALTQQDVHFVLEGADKLPLKFKADRCLSGLGGPYLIVRVQDSKGKQLTLPFVAERHLIEFANMASTIEILAMAIGEAVNIRFNAAKAALGLKSSPTTLKP